MVNTAVFAVTAHWEPEDLFPWCLAFGDGLHPVQWLTNNFLHGGFMHLAGNMVFLWSFGLVVEGKLGWTKFLPWYLGICLVYGLLVQLIMLGGFGWALGASGAIFGLMMMCLVWAPKNEFSCVLLLGRIFTFDMPIMAFAFVYLALQFGEAALEHFSMSTPMLHLTGAAVGAVPAFLLLKTGAVDCEGWDLLTVWAGRQGERPEQRLAEERRKKPVEPPQPLSADRRTEALAQIQSYLAADNPLAVLALDQKLSATEPDWQLPEPALVKTIRLLHGQKQYTASLAPMVQYLKHYSAQTVPMRLKLAQVLLVSEKRPHRALGVLEKLDPAALRPSNCRYSTS